MATKAIAIDIDDVLAATTPCLLRHVSRALAVTMKLGDITSESYWLEYGVSDQEAIRLVHDYNLKGFPNLEPIDGSVEALRKLSEDFELFLITSRDEAVRESTDAWVNEHFPGLISDVVHVGNKYVSKNVLSKSEVCKKLGATVAIDDAPAYVEDYISGGIKGILFGDYPWQQYDALPTGMFRAKDWRSVMELVYAGE